MADPFPPNIGAPATRAVTRVGILGWADLEDWSETELLALHGFGPKALRIMSEALGARGSQLRQADVPGASGADRVEEYLAGHDPVRQAALRTLRADLLRILPFGVDDIKYGMPAVTLHGKAIGGYAAFRDHCSYAPMSGDVIAQAGDLLDGYDVSKGVIRFGIDRPLPLKILRRLIKLRLDEISDVTNGVRREYFPDGRLKAAGKMKAGDVHGDWKWFRADGSLMRTGSFKNGSKTGTWTTWTEAGEPAKVTQPPPRP